MPLFRSIGTTPSERYLARLCQETFLSLWSYPNVFRDQGRRGGKGDGKELCDLLVVCGENVVIFSDKSCEFADSNNLQLDWCRWFRRSVLRSADQLFGAERWVREHPDRLFVDRKCTQLFPLPIVSSSNTRFHRIVVALNSSDRCRRELHGTGSLAIVPNIVGNAHIDPSDSLFQPFAIGQICPDRGFVHVFDDWTLDLVLRELDTVSDLLGYLRKKESLIIGGHLDRAFQEADMVAVYLTNIDQEGKHSFPQAADGSRLLVSNKAWGKLATHPQYMAKKEADRPSYVWDRIIEEFAKHTVQGSLVYNSPRSIAETEVGLRSMASESRFARRLLSNALRGVLEGVPAGQIGIRTVVSKDQRDITYVFVAMSNSGWPEDEFRLYRRDYLEKYCLVVASKHRSSQRFIGLATEAGLGPERSYDLICFEPGEWTVEKEAEARSIQDETKMFTRTTQRDVHDEEYPQLLGVQIRPPNPVTARVGRNDPCPCGSGKKYKRCCLR